MPKLHSWDSSPILDILGCSMQAGTHQRFGISITYLLSVFIKFSKVPNVEWPFFTHMRFFTHVMLTPLCLSISPCPDLTARQFSCQILALVLLLCSPVSGPWLAHPSMFKSKTWKKEQSFSLDNKVPILDAQLSFWTLAISKWREIGDGDFRGLSLYLVIFHKASNEIRVLFTCCC